MKAKNGKVKLERGERRFGNFFCKDEGHHIKFQDINGGITWRVDIRSAVGQYLHAALSQKTEVSEKLLTSYIAINFQHLMVVPDAEYLGEVLKISQAAVERHPEYYGMPTESLPDEEDKEVVKEVQELEEELKNVERD